MASDALEELRRHVATARARPQSLLIDECAGCLVLEWLDKNAEAIEVGLRVLALPKDDYVDMGQDPRSRYPWELYIEPSDGSRPANYSGATLLDVLRAMDEGDEDGK